MDCQTKLAKIPVLGSHADCSDCSCENCHDFENEGPNQVNLMATQNNSDVAIDNLISRPGKAAAHETNDDMHKELSRVLGALESRTVDRKTRKDDLESLEEEESNTSPNVALQQVGFYSHFSPFLSYRIHCSLAKAVTIFKRCQQHSGQQLWCLSSPLNRCCTLFKD